MKASALLSMLALAVGITAQAQTESAEKIGKMSVAEFNKINAKGNEMVAAITADEKPLSASDKDLMMKVAAGGKRQLMVSQAVLEKATDTQVKLLATSEVEEQTGVSAKLKEIATAKGITLPEEPDAETQNLVSKVQGMSGAEVDAFYLKESGVKGHELLQKTMTTVNANAKDAALKKLASATLPVIRTHLTVSRDEMSMMNKKATAATR